MKMPLGLVTLLTLSLALGGCVRPFMVPVEQGQIITPEMISKVKPGMTKEQVEFVLGDSMSNNPYQADTWYYVYTLEQNHLPRAEHQLILHFKDDKLSGMTGDYPPPATLQYQ